VILLFYYYYYFVVVVHFIIILLLLLLLLIHPPLSYSEILTTSGMSKLMIIVARMPSASSVQFGDLALQYGTSVAYSRGDVNGPWPLN